MATAIFTLLLAVIFPLLPIISCRPDSEILLTFKDNLVTKNPTLSTWNTTKPPCSNNTPNWVGLLCNNNTIWGLKLENMELEGVLDFEPLKEMQFLRTISFMYNNFDGPLPDLKGLSNIKTIYLSHNKFSGEIDEGAFDGMVSLKKLHLAHNEFSGSIPLSLTILPRLVELMLEDNEFEGEIPDFQQKRLQLVNVSSNKLAGPIPYVLHEMNVSSFSGNKELCGKPLASCSSSRKLSVATIINFVLVVVAALVALTSAFIILRRRKQTHGPEDQASVMPIQAPPKVELVDLDKMEQSPTDQSPKYIDKPNQPNPKLTFVRDDRERFDLLDLLKASAEILGGGIFGSTYKAAFNSGEVVVVKRFRQMNNVGKEEFHEHMRRLGRLRHPNVLPLVGFYYRKEEKLLVSDYVDNVSLAIHLHGNHARGQPSLDWPTRLKIVKGVAKGLLYLYNDLPSLITPHGHLKSTNVLLNKSFEPILTDYGLVPVVNQEHAQELMIAYKSPEYKQNSRVTKKTDVWSFGMLILEILTGKFLTHSLQQEKGDDTDLATWVRTVLREEDGCDEVFDREMGEKRNCEGEMMKMLEIGLSCCESDVEKRWEMREVVEKIDKLREIDIEGFSHS